MYRDSLAVCKQVSSAQDSVHKKLLQEVSIKDTLIEVATDRAVVYKEAYEYQRSLSEELHVSMDVYKKRTRLWRNIAIFEGVVGLIILSTKR